MDTRLHEAYERLEESHWWFVVRRTIVYSLLDKYVGSEATVLDYGCNSGFLVRELARKNYSVFGCDVSKEAVERGEREGIRNLTIAEGANIPFPDGSFDAILCLDVLEHIEDEATALCEIRRVMKPGAVLLLMVPALPLLWGLQDEVAHHKRRYTKKTLGRSLANSGLKIKRLSYFNFFLFPPILAVRLLQKFHKPKRVSDFDLNNRLTNLILKHIFGFESLLLRSLNFPVGVSLLAVAANTDTTGRVKRP